MLFVRFKLYMANQSQITLIETMVTWVAQLSYTSFAATLYEDTLRGALFDNAMLCGWTMAVNKNSKLRDVKLSQNRLLNTKSNVVVNPGHNPDMRVVSPSPLTIELKIRGEYGSSVSASVTGIDGDFEHVATGNADVFILLSDTVQYDNLRIGKGATTFSSELPELKKIKPNLQSFDVLRKTAAGGVVNAKALAQTVPSSFGDRVVVGFYI